MKNRYILVGSLLLSNFFSKGQPTDSIQNIKINQSEVEILYNHYVQDGNNSAITGGIGTEKLSVYGPSLSLKRSFNKNVIDFQIGADIISSASTDKIDFVKSSASKLDTRAYANINYTRKLEKNLSLSVGVGASIESDYLSYAHYLSTSKTSANGMQTYTAQFQYFNDDLRWGRLNGNDELQLVYPEELRFQEWYDVYRRKSYNLNLGFSQIVDARNVLGLFSNFSYQTGLLATPFHRIYFSDGSEAVEQFPKSRIKASLALKWNRFIGGNVILRNSVGGYSDDFGISGFSLENETTFKLNPRWSLFSNLRFYNQKASKFFAPIDTHNSASSFYTSDYDLSKFSSIKIGLGAKFSPYSYSKPNKRFDTATLSYHYYHRSNNLSAHMISLAINSTKFHVKKKP